MAEEKRFTMRMDGDLYEVLSKCAELDKRSIAKEIEYMVENYILIHSNQYEQFLEQSDRDNYRIPEGKIPDDKIPF